VPGAQRDSSGIPARIDALKQASDFAKLLGVRQVQTHCGFIPENRPYHPHITLARRKGKSGGEELRNLKLQIGRQPDISSFTASSFVLYESIPTPQGSRYETRERFSLGALK